MGPTNNQFILEEIYDRTKLKKLIDSGKVRNTFDETKTLTERIMRHNLTDLQQLEWIYDNIDYNSKLIVKYCKKTNNGIGRFYVTTKASYTIIPRIYRNYLCDELYYDFDMKNAHLSILCELIDKYNLVNCDNIKRFFNNFEKYKIIITNVFAFRIDPKEKFKELNLSMLFGFGDERKFEKLLEKNNITSSVVQNNKNIFDFLKNYLEELNDITDQLKSLNIYDIDTSHKDFNEEGSWLALCLQTIEAEIIVALKNYLNSQYSGIVGTYEYDGLKLNKSIVDDIGFIKIENKIKNFLKSNNHNLISIVNKSMDEKISLPIEEKANAVVAIDDEVIFDDDVEESKANEVVVEKQIAICDTTLTPTNITTSFSPIIITPTTLLTENDTLLIEIDTLSTEIDTLHLINTKELGDTDKKQHLQNIKNKKIDLKNLKQKYKEQLKKQKEQEKEELKKQKEQEIEQRKNDNIFVRNDDEAIDIIIQEIGHLFIYVNNQMYYKLGNKWVNNEEQIKHILMTYILESKIYEENNEYNLIPYAQNVKTSKNIREGLWSKIICKNRNDNLYNLFHTSTKNKLCFNDGVLDFIEKQFILWEDIPENTIYTTVIIDRDFANYFSNPNRHFINTIYKDIMLNLFGEKTDLALKFFSRAITGNYEDKNFMSYMGNRDCGKGILYALFEWAFKEYVGSFNLENITCKRESNKSSDLAKENAWLLPLQFKRFVISQETDDNDNGNINKMLKLSNKALKSIMSGGDIIKVRALYKDIIDISLELAFGIFGNNEISISGNDSAKHHLKCSGVKTFVTIEEYESSKQQFGDAYVSSYSIRDETLKEKVKTDDYANAMVYLLYENFINKPISIINDENDDENTYCPVRTNIFKIYELTDNDEDRVSKDELYEIIGGDKKKIVNELKQLGCVGDCNCKTTIKYKIGDEEKTKRVQAFKGLKLKVIVEDENI